MRVALVHDYIKEFGGAERTLKVLTEIFPGAPIYTAFKTPGSDAAKEFTNVKVIESPWAFLLRFKNLHSPLRFLLPLIWKSIDLSSYDLVITSCSGYIARGFKVNEKTKVVAYCHTPPRFLYGYETSIDWQKYWIIRVYAIIVNHFLRIFDFESAMRVDKWIANSKNVAERIKKFYRKESVIIYPPIEVEKITQMTKEVKREDYFLIVARLVGAKGLEEAVKAAVVLGFKLKIAGGGSGYSTVKERLEKLGKGKIEMLGRVDDEELYRLYAEARGFIALAKDEDFGMAVVEAQAAGTPVLCYWGGGFKESVIDGETGVFIKSLDEKGIEEGLKKFEKIRWDRKKIIENARRFSVEEFKKKVEKVIAVEMKR